MTAAHGIATRLQSPARELSAMRATDFDQNPKPLLIGERVNAQGSRKVKRLLLADDYEAIADVAREQVESGAHMLDVCVAVTERADEAEQMAKVVKLLSMTVDAPIMIDSTEPAVIERALEAIPGRAIINSINMENGRERIDRVVPIAKKHGAALVALTIDPIGMAKTRERKLEVAKKIYDIVVGEYGLAAARSHLRRSHLHARDRRPGMDRLGRRNDRGHSPDQARAAGRLHEPRRVERELWSRARSARGAQLRLPASLCRSGARHGDRESGARPAVRRDFGRRARAGGRSRVQSTPRRAAALHRTLRREREARSGERRGKEDPTAGMTLDQKVHWMVVHRKKDGIEAALDAAGVREQPVRVLNEVLLPAMKEVGDKFGAGELILPFVLQSAEVMKKAVKHLELFLERAEGYTKGRVVLATVYGDVHDIGKSLVNTILSNNGYTVYDLGKQVPVNTIVEKALEVNADAIGLSALLVSTSKQMPLCVQELDRRGLKLPVLIGGAAINRRFGRRALFVEGDRAYGPGVFYCKDAFEGLETMDRLQDRDRRGCVRRQAPRRCAQRQVPRDERRQGYVVGQRGRRTQRRVERQSGSERAVLRHAHAQRHSARRSLLAARPRRAVSSAVGRSRLRPGIRGDGSHANSNRRSRDSRSRRSATAGCKPRAIYGLFPVQTRGNDLVVYDPDAYAKDGTHHRDRALPFPATGRTRPSLHRRLFPLGGVGRRRRRRHSRS